MNAHALKSEWARWRKRLRKPWSAPVTTPATKGGVARREVVLGRLREQYGYTREQAECEFDWSVKVSA